MEKMITCLWFDSNGEEAANFYLSVFKNGKLGAITRYGKEGFETHRRPAGSVLTVEFQIDGHDFIALNGGPVFKFNEAISFQIICKTQAEIDHYWQKLAESGGQNGQCGWLKDRFGVSWQVVPADLPKFLQDEDPQKAGRVMNAMLHMQKLDIETLREAYRG